jgi:AraC-like DNA-binding protein
MAGADARLHGILSAQADAMLAALRPARPLASFLEEVQRALHDGVGDNDFSLTHLADRLSLSVRTLQRRLRSEGLTHRGLVRQLREALAKRALDGSVSQGQIARTLGYAGAGSFHRAFKRWSGMTPGELRARAARPRSISARRKVAAQRDGR